MIVTATSILTFIHPSTIFSLIAIAVDIIQKTAAPLLLASESIANLLTTIPTRIITGYSETMFETGHAACIDR